MLVYLFIGILVVWVLAITFYIWKISNYYQRLVSQTDKRSLQEILNKVLLDLEFEKKSRIQLQREIEIFSQKMVYHIQRVGIVRFNPFSDTGGDQSFVLSILDGKNNGIVLTSLHNRGITRWYAKKVREGNGIDFDLSEEEKKAISNASVLTVKSELTTRKERKQHVKEQ